MTKTESEITERVNRETRAWDTQNVDLLISITKYKLSIDLRDKS